MTFHDVLTMTRVMPAERGMSAHEIDRELHLARVRPASLHRAAETLGSVRSAGRLQRLRPGTSESDRAGASASLLMPTRPSTTRGAGLRLPDDAMSAENAPIIHRSPAPTCPRMSEATWKVRARAEMRRASGVKLVSRGPRTNLCRGRKQQVAGSGNRTKWDLTAQFGPIRPRISPCSSVTEADVRQP